ncbi:MAG: uridine kinase [Blastocatellia bacterium]|nr:uridine kinase [Blastocatellia bacterium]
MTDISRIVEAILARRSRVPPERSALVAVTGIDGSGKGYLTEKIVSQLRRQGSKAVGINVDGWLNLPDKRFNADDPARHFYEHAIRFDEMFRQLILPLRDNRTCHVVADFTEETASEYRKHIYHFEDVEVLVLEGIYLLKRAYRSHFDLSFWVDCSFETALERALERGQEGLPREETIGAYETIYFPAQRIHFAEDDPQSAADIIINNDPRQGRVDFC